MGVGCLAGCLTLAVKLGPVITLLIMLSLACHMGQVFVYGSSGVMGLGGEETGERKQEIDRRHTNEGRKGEGEATGGRRKKK